MCLAIQESIGADKPDHRKEFPYEHYIMANPIVVVLCLLTLTPVYLIVGTLSSKFKVFFVSSSDGLVLMMFALSAVKSDDKSIQIWIIHVAYKVSRATVVRAEIACKVDADRQVVPYIQSLLLLSKLIGLQVNLLSLELRDEFFKDFSEVVNFSSQFCSGILCSHFVTIALLIFINQISREFLEDLELEV